MSLTTPITLLRLIFPNKNFLAAILLNDGCLYGGSGDSGRTDADSIAISSEKNILHFDLLTDFVG